MKLSLDAKLRSSLMRFICYNENGVALVIGLMFIAILAMVGTTAVVMTTTDIQIGGNYKTSVQASNAAQAGISEALYRLGLFDDSAATTPQAPPSGSMINVNNLLNNNAAISIDPNGLLSDGDSDGDGIEDEIDELNYNGTYDNRNWQAKIMLSTSTPAGLVSNTTFYTNTIQPSGSWLEYSSSTDDGTALTIEFLKDTGDMDLDSNTAEIVFYDGSLANPYNVDTGATRATGQPIVVVTSTGRTPSGSIGKVQVTAVYQPINIQAEAAVMVDLTPALGGNSLITGFNHYAYVSKADKPNNPNSWGTTTQFYKNGVDNFGGPGTMDWPNNNTPYSDDDILLIGPTGWPNNEEELGDTKSAEEWAPYAAFLETSGHKPGVWTTVSANPALPPIDPAGNNEIFGGCGGSPVQANLLDPSCYWKEESAPAWLTLAQLLGLDQEIVDKILASANVTEADMDGSGQLSVAPQGVIYINNAGGTTLKITNATPDCDNGWGLMYITGDVQLQDVGFKGLLYVEGNASVAAGFWMAGCMAVKGTVAGAFAAGGAHFLYSSEVLSSYVNKGMKFLMLTWKDEGLN